MTNDHQAISCNELKYNEIIPDNFESQFNKVLKGFVEDIKQLEIGGLILYDKCFVITKNIFANEQSFYRWV